MMKILLVGLTGIAIALSLAFCLGGCAAPDGRGPSTAKVQAQIESAQVQRSQISEQNRAARTAVSRIDAKDQLIDRWYQLHNRKKNP